MSEYVTPRQHIEETASHSSAIEGVTTSTLGMVGLTEYGPVPHLATKVGLRPGPVLVESFSEYLQVFGGVAISGRPCLLALAARAFFDNGGRRLFVSRVFEFSKAVDSSPGIDLPEGFGSLVILAQGEPLIAWKARWPGSVASRIRVAMSLRRRGNALVGGELQGVLPGAVVEVADPTKAEIPDHINPVRANVRVVARCADGRLGYLAATGGADHVDPAEVAFPLTLEATVSLDDRVDVYSELELGREHPRCIFDVLQAKDPDVANALVWLDMVDGGAGSDLVVGELLDAVLSLRDGGWLTGGGDGGALSPELLIGDGLDNDNEGRAARGLGALAVIDEIALVAIPDIVTLSEVDQATTVNALIQHCGADGYRMAIVDPPRASSISDVRRFRAQFDTKHAALYYPWLRVVDPNGVPDVAGLPRLLDVPPSGAIAGIYARSDTERGVHKAPDKLEIRGIAGLTSEVTSTGQQLLNEAGINSLLLFQGRSHLVWGASTMSSDPEWTYVAVRRLLLYLEHSIDRSTGWVVFEPNAETLWKAVRRTIEDFLLQVWSSGALVGTKPEEAYFVRCDRTTMTQGDVDTGRLICLIGVAPIRPAEFVVFRIGQWTSDAGGGRSHLSR